MSATAEDTSNGTNVHLRVFACERCTRRKQRCDRILPTCTPCRTSSSACTNSDREAGVAPGKDNNVARKGFVTTLLERIAALERQEPPSIPEHTRQDPVRQDQDPEETAKRMDMTTLSLSAVAEPRSREGEFLKHLSTPGLIAGVTETYGGNPEATSRVDSLWEGISTYIRHPVSAAHQLHIPREEASKALQTYLDVVDFRFPRVPVAKVQAGIEAISSTDEAYRDVLTKDPAHIFMAYAVVAIVPLVSDAYPISQGSWVSVHLLGKCLKVLNRVFNQEDGVDVIQCLHLLVVLSIHCSAAGSAWHLIGFAMNKCIALGYHHEDVRVSASLSKTDLQQRRWAFWGCYLLDRLICAALGRPFSISDRDICVPLPEDDDGKDAYSIHLFRYALVLSSITEADAPAQSGFDDGVGRCLHWRTNTPPHEDPQYRDVFLFQTSLFNTLMLRVAIREIGRCFTVTETWNTLDASKLTIDIQYTPETSHSSSAQALEAVRIQRISLLQTCRAVARSLDRTRMIGRSYLSITTGYSALSMGLACLYYIVVTGNAAGSATWGLSNGSPDYEPHAILDLACKKLEIVGRQFPRLQEYGVMLNKLRSFGILGYQASGENKDELQELVRDIGPRHLRTIGGAILHMATLERTRISDTQLHGG